MTPRAVLDELDARRAELADEVTDALGTGADASDRAAAAWRPSRLLIRLAALAAVAAAPAALLVGAAPGVSDAVGSGRATIGGLAILQWVAIPAAAFALVAFLNGRTGPRPVVVAAATVGALAATAIAFAATGGAIGLAVIVAAPAAAAARVVHPALLIDGHVPSTRGRALIAHRAADTAGIAAAFLTASGLAQLGLTWRGAFLALAIVSFTVIALCARGLETLPASSYDQAPPAPLREHWKRALNAPTVRRVLGIWAALGALVIPALSFVGFFLSDRWHVTSTGRLGVVGVILLFGLPVLAFAGPRADQAFAADPGGPMRLVTGAALVCAVAFLVAAASPWFGVAVVALGVALAATTVIAPLLDLTALSVVSSPARPVVAAMGQAAFFGIGGVGGFLLFAGIDRRFGLAGALATLIGPALVVGLLARRASTDVAADLQRRGDDVVVRRELSRLAATGRSLPLLACRGIDFSYGPLQVLFGVDFTVDDGELVALLGTNGAGKSTLLRVISGLGTPTRGSVHLRGEDITFLDPQARLRTGIAQVPGGRAVFGPMSVADNLRVIGAGAGRGRRHTEQAIESVFEVFPQLAARRDHPAAVLSGGEQQMLGLSKALLLEPRLLLVDELSLGLAPIVVGQLLDLVRRINAAGTAVVLVEQSLNVALSIADHAYFMEKGEIRFDGPTSRLANRKDLVRSVFLGGAAQRLAKRERSA